MVYTSYTINIFFFVFYYPIKNIISEEPKLKLPKTKKQRIIKEKNMKVKHNYY